VFVALRVCGNGTHLAQLLRSLHYQCRLVSGSQLGVLTLSCAHSHTHLHTCTQTDALSHNTVTLSPTDKDCACSLSAYVSPSPFLSLSLTVSLSRPNLFPVPICWLDLRHHRGSYFLHTIVFFFFPPPTKSPPVSSGLDSFVCFCLQLK